MSINDTFPRMPDILPEGQLGIAKVDHFEISEQASSFSGLRAVIQGRRDDFVPPGKYARLIVGRELMMTDTQMERRSNYEVVRRARGHVFIAGLGLGMILHPILNKPEVTHVTVVEKFGDVIRLVGPTLPHPEKVTFVEADALDYKPAKGTKFDVIYFDIWPSTSQDNLPDMTRLHRRFAHFKAPGGWVDSWMKSTLTDMKRREARNPRRGWW